MEQMYCTDIRNSEQGSHIPDQIGCDPGSRSSVQGQLRKRGLAGGEYRISSITNCYF